MFKTRAEFNVLRACVYLSMILGLLNTALFMKLENRLKSLKSEVAAGGRFMVYEEDGAVRLFLGGTGTQPGLFVSTIEADGSARVILGSGQSKIALSTMPPSGKGTGGSVVEMSCGNHSLEVKCMEGSPPSVVARSTENGILWSQP